jgi:hypothetical protein
MAVKPEVVITLVVALISMRFQRLKYGFWARPMHREQTGSDIGCPDTQKLQMAAKTGRSYNFFCRIDINVIPRAEVGFPGTGNVL